MLSPPPQSTDAEKGGDVVQLVSSSSVAAPRTIDADRLRVVMEAAERHCDKIDPCSFLELLPRNVPAASVVNFVTVSMEHATANQHNLQVNTLSIVLTLLEVAFNVANDFCDTDYLSTSSNARGKHSHRPGVMKAL